MQHHVNIGAAVPDVNYTVMADLQFRPEFLKGSDLSVTGRNPNDGLNLAR